MDGTVGVAAATDLTAWGTGRARLVGLPRGSDHTEQGRFGSQIISAVSLLFNCLFASYEL